jgi:TPR repeat protein
MSYDTSLDGEQDPAIQTNIGVELFNSGDFENAAKFFNKAAAQGYNRAQHNLGAMYYSGIFFNKDIYKAIYFYELASGAGYYKSAFNLGLIYYDLDKSQEYIDKAILWFNAALEHGEDRAGFFLGKLFLDASHIENNKLQSLHFFEQSSSKGCATSQYELSKLLRDAELGVNDLRRADDLLLLSATAGVHEAQIDVADALNVDDGLTRFIDKLYWLHGAASTGSSEAQYMLGDMFYLGKPYAPESDYKVATEYYSMAAMSGHVMAQYRLGLMYKFGDFYNKDKDVYIKDSDMAISWLEKAALQGNADSQYELAELINEEYPGNKKAFYWCDIAASKDHARALFLLSVFYLEGRLCEQNNAKSLSSLKRSAEIGEAEACKALGEAYRHGLIGLDINHIEAIKYHTKAAELYNIESIRYIANEYMSGENIDKDYQLSLFWLKKLVEFNEGHAYIQLALMYIQGKGVNKDKEFGDFLMAKGVSKALKD